MSSHYKSRPPKKPKPALTTEDRLKAKYVRLDAQISNKFSVNALKTCESILRLKDDEDLARRTKLQLLLTLDRFEEAASFANPTDSLERAYALHKLGRQSEAKLLLQDTDDRAVRLLTAQIAFKSEDYTKSKEIYHDLLLSCDETSPEYADLENNLAACDSYLDFAKSIPDRIAEAREGSNVDAQTLETTPVGPLVSANYKASTSAPIKVSQPRPSARKRKTKLPPSVAKLEPEDRPAIDPERWLPKIQRKGYLRAQATKREENKRRKKEKSATQGSAPTQEPVIALHTSSKKKKGKK